MKTVDILTELFTSPAKWNWNANGASEWAAVFYSNPGVISVVFDNVGNNAWEVAFSSTINMDKFNFDATGAGDQFKIFATVILIIKDFITKNKDVQTLEFSSDNNGARNSRTSLYTKMVNKLAGNVGFAVHISYNHKAGKTEFTLSRKDDSAVALTELFDSKYKWQSTTSDTGMSRFGFDSKVGPVDVYFKPVPKGSQDYEVIFSVDGKLKRSNKGDQFKIFATVIDIIETFFHERPAAESINFVAGREGAAADHPDIVDSRLVLYQRMLERFAKKHDMEFASTNIARMKEFILRKKHVTTEGKIKLPKQSDTLGIDRKDMPQVHKDHYKSFFEYLLANGGTAKHETVKADKLKPVQREFSKAGVKKMIKNIKNNKPQKPCITSGDNYIIDGHHRWLAAMHINDDIDIDIIRVNLPVKRLLDLASKFKHTTYKDIYEQQLTELSSKKRKKYSKQATREIKLIIDKLTYELFKIEKQLPQSLTTDSFEKLSKELDKRRRGLAFITADNINEGINGIRKLIKSISKLRSNAPAAMDIVKSRRNAIRAAGDRAMSAGQDAAIKASVAKEIRNSKIANTGHAIVKGFGNNPGSSDLVGGALTVAAIAAANKTTRKLTKQNTPILKGGQQKFNDRVVPVSINSPRTLIPK